jgi:hypothetical protein
MLVKEVLTHISEYFGQRFVSIGFDTFHVHTGIKERLEFPLNISSIS